MAEKNIDEALKNKLKNLLKLSTKRLKEEATILPFNHEFQIHGFLRCLLKNNMQNSIINIHLPIQHEYKTHLFYHRPSDNNDGFLYRSELYKSVIKKVKHINRGQIDLALLCPNDDCLIPFQYNDKRVKKAFVGIELQLPPKANGRKESTFKNHVIVDAKKLTDSENKIDLKYLICIVYNPNLDFDVEKFLREDLKSIITESKYNELNIAYFEINSDDKRIEREIIIPDNWLEQD